MEERPMVHIRLPKDLLKAVDHESVELDLDRARTIEVLLRKALGQTVEELFIERAAVS